MKSIGQLKSMTDAERQEWVEQASDPTEKAARQAQLSQLVDDTDDPTKGAGDLNDVADPTAGLDDMTD